MSDDDLLAMMYSDEATVPTVATEASTARTRTIKVGIIEYEVPTVEYMRFLEATIAQQAYTIDQHRHAIERIQTLLQGTRGYVRRHAGALDDIRQNLTRRSDHFL